MITNNTSHSIMSLRLLLLLSGSDPLTTAQDSTNPSPSPPPPPPQSSSDPNYPYGNFDPSMSTVMVILFFAFFFIAFLSIYIRQCSEDSYEPPNHRVTTPSFRQPKRGVEPAIVNSFPIFRYGNFKAGRIGKEVLDCAVCLSEFGDDDAIKIMPKCRHIFHRECIDAWLACQATCPVCRANLIPNSREVSAEGSEQTNMSRWEIISRRERILEPDRNQVDQC